MNDPENNAETELPRRALRMNDFCRAYGISRATAYKMIARGQLRTVLIAGRRLVPVDVAEALLRSEAA
jgi:predicted DNA-binding transcriptional regulator AlpA